ncbi:MAG: hypothetical protein QW230_02060 [Thermofilum sp.]
MRRCISNLVVLLIVVGITVAVGVFVGRLVVGGLAPTYDKPNHLQVSSKMASAVTSQVLRLEVVFSNPTKHVFCVKLDRVAIYTSFPSPSESVSVSQISPSIVIAPGSSANYEMVFRSSMTYSSGIMVAYFNMYACASVQACSCSGTPTYVEAVPIRF